MCENLCISSRSIKNSLGIFRTHVVGQANVLVNPLVVNSFSFCVYSFIPPSTGIGGDTVKLGHDVLHHGTVAAFPSA